MWGKNFKERFVWRIDRAVLHWNADAETNVEAMTQIDVAQLATFNRQPVRLRHLEARLRHVPAQLLAEWGRKVARRRYLCVCLGWQLGGWRPLLCLVLFHIKAFAL